MSKPRRMEQFTMDGEFIQVHRSVWDAAKAVGKNVNSGGSAIRRMAGCRTRSAYGFKWRYEGDLINMKIVKYQSKVK